MLASRKAPHHSRQTSAKSFILRDGASLLRHVKDNDRHPRQGRWGLPRVAVASALCLCDLSLMEKTLIENLIDHSVDLNGVFVPVGSVQSVLGRYAQSLFVMNDHEIYRVSTAGSATAVRYRGRYLLVCCRHQLKNIDPSRIAILTHDGEHCLSSGGFRHFDNSLNDWDYHDLAAFDFTEPCLAYPSIRERFYLLKSPPPDGPNVQVPFLILAGYPSKSQDYDLDDNRLGLAKRIQICVLDSQPLDDSLLLLRTVDSANYDPDGMSGGSAFSVHMVDGASTAYFAGVIVRAGNGFFRIVKAGYVLRFLDQFVNDLDS